jgi:amino acid adenylation domain-containing protein
MKKTGEYSNRLKRLNKKQVEDIFALTPMQEGILFHYLYEPQSVYYFEQLSLVITGELDPRLFERAWNVVIETNEMLRAVFRWKNLEHPVQVILKEHKLQWEYHDFSGSDISKKVSLIEKAKAEDRKRKFDLGDIAFRVTLCRLEKARYVMIISNHHILYDGWSNGILLKEFFQTYHTLAELKRKKDRWIKPPAKNFFEEFVQWIQNQDKDKQRQFWEEYLAGFTSRAELPIKIKKRDTERSTGVGNHPVILEKTIKDRLEFLARKHRLTLAAFFYCAWGILLQRYCGSEDVIFGTTVSGRSAPVKGIADMVGLFINTIPLRIRTGADETIMNLLAHIDDILPLREKYESTPLVDIKKYSAVENNEELFDSIVVVENYPLDRNLMRENKKSRGRGLVVNSYSIVEVTTFDLTAAVTIGDKIKINFISNPLLFEESSIVRLSGHFTNILNGILKYVEKDISSIELLSEEERHQILIDFNKTAGQYPNDKTIHALFEEQAERTPDRLALVGAAPRGCPALAQHQMTYRELDERSDRLACLLIEKGVLADSIVGIKMKRSLAMIIGIFSILKAGGAYLPIDPDYPQERIDYMLADSGAKILLSEVNGECELIDAGLGNRLACSAVEGRLHLSPASAASLAYIIYTSGTTGRPKGTMIRHHSLVNRLHWMQKKYPLDESDTILHKTPFTFDVSVWEIFWWAVVGARVCLLAPGGEKDPGLTADTAARSRVTVMHFVPSMLTLFLGYLQQSGHAKKLSCLRQVIASGEALTVSQVTTFKKNLYDRNATQLANLYGPTEATIDVSYFDCFRQDVRGVIPIGKPIDNICLYILDKHLHIQPPGVVGELFIGGVGLSRGYLNQPELTAEKFISGFYRSYRSYRTDSSQKIYRTGDLARWLPDGNIDFLGRLDDQVKIRGFRIEPGEIENRLLTHPAVKEAVVMAREGQGAGRYLCAYIVLYSAEHPGVEELRSYLASELPHYMVPSHFVILEKIPLTPNGKVDRKALPEPDVISGSDYIPPRDDTENMVAEIWAEVLGIDKKQVGIHDNFFRLGGHSLKAAALSGRIYKIFSVEIPINKIFEKPTIEDISRFIAGAKKAVYLSIEPVEEKEYYPLSSPQERLFLIQQMDPPGITYNLTGLKELQGKLDTKRFEECFRRLIERHESLRTFFKLVDGKPVQRIHREVEFEIESYSAAGDTGKRIIDFVRPFDLSKAPLLRVGLVHLHRKHLLMFDMHHIISDGVSMEIFIKEFTALYAGDESLPELRLQYQDFSHWQNHLLISPEIKKQETYWLHRFEGGIPVLELPLDYPRPSVQQFAGKQVSFAVGAEIAGELNRFVRENGGTRFTVLLGVFSLLLSKLSSREDIVVGTPAAGRSHHDLENIIGMFVNTLALRINASNRMTFTEFTRDVRKNFLAAFENRDYPYEYLVDRLIVNRDLSRNPLFDAAFGIQGIEMEQVELPALELTPYEYEVRTSKFDLTLIGTEIPGNLRFIFEYSTNLFKDSTIRRYISYFKELLSGILADKDRHLSEIEIIPEEEKQQVLFDFNDTAAEFPRDKTIHELFEEQASTRPDGAALVGSRHDTSAVGGAAPPADKEEKTVEAIQLTYGELNRKANQVAHLLKEKGVTVDSIVGIKIERCVEMIIAILGILKAGGAYLPIDPGYPRERIDYMLKDSNARVLMKKSEIRISKSETNPNDRNSNDRNAVIPGIVLNFEHSNFEFVSDFEFRASNFKIGKAEPSNLAYVIYTSGSTGQPKGVLIRHQGVVNMVWFHRRVFRENPGSHISQVASPAFDAMAFEVWPCLLGGAALYIIEKETRIHPRRLKDWLIRHQITISFQPTLMARGLLEEQWPETGALEILRTAGERLNRYPTRPYPFRLYNLYGPTEDTIWTTWAEIPVVNAAENLNPPPIGKPAANRQVYILSSGLKPQPVGVVGELCISGNGLARGYLNNPELTAEKFDHDLWDFQDYHDDKKKENYQKFFGGSRGAILQKSPPGRRRLYRTGDLARWLEDGNIEFIGRKDLQVKIRGFRIEPGEIENYLLGHGSIKEAVVSVREDGKKDKYLCAYIVSDTGIFIPGLRDYLAKKLPSYMVPAYFVELEKIPLTLNGKIDWRALPEPEIALTKKYIAPGNKTEECLVEIWSDVLEIEKEKIGIDDNFFELGGHSLKAAMVMGRIHKTFDVEISFLALFESPTVRGISRCMEKALKGAHQPIPPVEEKEYYPLAVSQKRFYVFQTLRPDDTSYNITETMLLEGEMPGEKIEAVFRQMFLRHECLRTSFHMVQGEPVQRFHREVEFAVKFYDLEKVKEVDHIKIVRDFVRAFDLTRAPLSRVALIKIAPDKHFLTFDIHHIIADGTSMGIFIRDFLLLYNRESLPPLKIRFRDFVEWQRQRRASNRAKSREIPGMKELEDELLNLPTDYPRSSVQTSEGSMLREDTGKQETAALHDFCLHQGATLYMVLLAAFNIMLSKLSGQENIAVGSPIAGRVHVDLDNLMGLFLHTICLRNRVPDDERFLDFLKKVKQRAIHAYENQDYQYHELVEKIKTTRDTGRNPLFDVMLVLQNMEMPGIELDGLTITLEMGEHSTSKFDLTVYCEEKDPLVFYWEYSTTLFKQETIRRFMRYFRNILSHIQEKPHQTIGEIEMITEGEKHQILYDFNEPSFPYPADKTISQLVEEQAEKTPGNKAVIWSTREKGDNISMTYRELNQTSNRLARLLRNKGAGPGTIIGLMVERSLEMVTALQGILKAGGTYLPIDPQYPDNRIARMLGSSRASMLLTGTGILAKKSLPTLSGNRDILVLPLDEPGGELEAQSPEKLVPLSGPGHLIYIIFTSGSTGMPKGAGVYHRGFMNLMYWFVTEFGLDEEDRNLLLTSLSFDLTQKNLYASLMKGGTICIPSLNYFEPRALLREIRAHRVTWINCTPSMFHKMVEYEESGEEKRLTSLRYVFLGGEPIFMPGLIRWLESPECRAEIVNTYGPTECTDICNYYRIEEPRRFLNETVPIGKPVYNVKLYIPDRKLHLQPVGVPGELLIGGAGVGIGYINDRDLTARKFIRHSFEPGEPEQLLYRTGDLVKWLVDGNIEFLGRIDHQVKVRGFRIELGEIEGRLSSHAAVKEALVMAREQEGMEKHLCAYIVPSTFESLEVNELRDYLAAELPDYMVPTYFVVLEKMPLNPNGKVDRKALPEPDITSGKNYIPPRNETEDILAGIWAEVLGIEKKQVGIHDNFFRLGGHSLKAAALIGKIHKAFSAEIPIAELFNKPTIESISRYIDQTGESIYTSVKPVEEKEYYPLSAPQKRLFLIHQMAPSSTAYNLPDILELEGNPDKKRLNESFKKLIDRHESLRTSFYMIEDEPVQRIQEENSKFQITNSKQIPDHKFQVTNIIEEFVQPFDLSKAPLLRVGLVKMSERDYVLLIDMHHIITDGFSQVILLREFIDLYGGKESGPLRIRYKDYAQWQQKSQKERLKKQEGYWVNQFKADLPLLNLPTDYPRPVLQSFEGHHIAFVPALEDTRQLKKTAAGQGATLNMVLLAIFNVLLAKLGGQEDIIVGIPIAGRQHAELENIIGMFVNTLALRNYPRAEKTFSEFLEEVKKRTLEAFENQDYPFEELVEQVPVNRDIGRNPLLDVMCVLQNLETQKMEIPGLTLSTYEHEKNVSKFDLTLTGIEREEDLLFSLEYCTKLFKKETIERFIGYFNKLLSEVTKNPGKQLGEIGIISDTEKNRILYDFNNTERAYPDNKTLHELFDEQAAKPPEKIALVGSWQGAAPPADKRAVGNVSVTYAELNRESDRLAHLLREKGVEPGAFVGIMVERSIEMITGILGILKAGGAYVPLDPEAPDARINHMLQECNVKILLAAPAARVKGGVKKRVVEIIDIPAILSSSTSIPTSTGKVSPANLAYVIFTSGSTGKPKGVPITHDNLSPLLHWGYRQLELGPADRTLQNLSYYFDWSVWEIFITLTSGTCLFSVPDEILLNPEACIAFMDKTDITVLHATPTQYSYLLRLERRMKTLKYLFLGAEKLSHDLAKRSFASVSRDCRIFNMYGPTECTIIAATLEFKSSDLKDFEGFSGIPIGIPVGNTELLVLDKYLRMCPLNVSGELYISGDGVAAGYLNNPELTAERFLDLTAKTREDKRISSFRSLYRTGDLSRWLLNGNIEFLGRIDHQVKIRGFRIELGEIENRLLSYDKVKEAIVVLRGEESGSQAYLCAYVVAADDYEVSRLREYLAEELPDYMIPPYIVGLDRIPLNPNGKVDRKALPAPGIISGPDFVGPRDEVEERLVKMWSNVLGIEKEKIGVTANFFESGGHSLNAAVLSTKIHKELDVKMPLAQIFKTPTIKGLSGYIQTTAKNKYTLMEPVEKKEYYILSPAQKRLYILQQMSPESTAYNMPNVISIPGEPVKAKLEAAFEKLINRHESLRTSFPMIDDEPVQKIHEKPEFSIRRSAAATGGDNPPHAVIENFIHPFDLSQAPLLRTVLLKIKETGHFLLIIDMHHIICDGISHDILVTDFLDFYNGRELAELRIQYKDFSYWWNRPGQKQKMKKQEKYWVEQFKNEIPLLNLPIDFPRPAEKSFEGDSINFEIGPVETRFIKEYALKEHVTLFMLLIAVFYVLLSRLSGVEDIVIGTGVMGRGHPDLAQIIGMFVNMLALRNKPGGDMAFRDFLETVKQNTLNAFENQDYNLENLVELVLENREANRSPLFDAAFSVQEIKEKKLEIPGLKVKPYDYKNRTSKFDITFYGEDAGDRIYFNVEYCTKLFKKKTIEKYAAYFKEIIAAVHENENVKLKEIRISHGLISSKSDLPEMDFGF